VEPVERDVIWTDVHGLTEWLLKAPRVVHRRPRQPKGEIRQTRVAARTSHRASKRSGRCVTPPVTVTRRVGQ
jgi:hypothetical protein